MWSRLAQIIGFGNPRFTRPDGPVRPKLLVTTGCVDGLNACLAPERRKGHEGIAYLFGRTDGMVTLAVTAFRPKAKTTPGSFLVEPRAMARGVRAAADLGLQIVAQVHTHPGAAYHSDGDIEGARIRYAGYASIVLPEYGRHLPRFDGAAVYISDKTDQWIELSPEEVVIISERVPWTRSNGGGNATTARSGMREDV